MSFNVLGMIEDKRAVKPSRWNRVFRISLKQLLVLILVIVAALASFGWASDRIETHKRWASMVETSQEFGIVFSEVYVRLPSITENATTDPTHFWFTNELDFASWTLSQLVKVDEAHESELYWIEDLIVTLRDASINGVLLNDSQFWNLSNGIKLIAIELPEAYWNPLNTTSVNSETGPPFWYFGPSPPDETMLQTVATLAMQLTETIPKST
ncbi:MAG: hypothetical protein WCD81_12055 [Candidatus Bathyarchaeia archaeon]